MAEYTYENESDAKAARRELIEQGVTVSMIAYDEDRMVYVWDTPCVWEKGTMQVRICGELADMGDIDTGTDYICIAHFAHAGTCNFRDAMGAERTYGLVITDDGKSFADGALI